MIIFAVFLIIIGLFYWRAETRKKAFLKSLKGEIVYSCRDGLVLNIYKISANGTNKKLLYKNTDKVNSNSMGPIWSKDGSRIYFGAMKNGKWETFSLDSEGNGPAKIANVAEKSLIPVFKDKTDGISVEDGSIYYTDDHGNKKQVYYYPRRLYNREYYPGAMMATWSPDKKFIVFAKSVFLESLNIFVTNKEGTIIVKITKGQEPDWKY